LGFGRPPYTHPVEGGFCTTPLTPSLATGATAATGATGATGAIAPLVDWGVPFGMAVACP